MTYEITLLAADIRDPMDGSMVLGLNYEGKQQAKLAYEWDSEKFSAVFHGHAPSLPVPAHPAVLLNEPIVALYALKTKDHQMITDVFQDHQVIIHLPT